MIDILKVDIEFYEWSALPNMFSTGVLRYVRQFHLETHHQVNSVGKGLKDRLGLCRTLYDEGFRLYSSNPNRYTINLQASKFTKKVLSACYEIYFVNINAKIKQ